MARQVCFADVTQVSLVGTSGLRKGLESESGGKGQGLPLRRNPRRVGITTLPPTQSGCVEMCSAPTGGQRSAFSSMPESWDFPPIAIQSSYP